MNEDELVIPDEYKKYSPLFTLAFLLRYDERFPHPIWSEGRWVILLSLLLCNRLDKRLKQDKIIIEQYCSGDSFVLPRGQYSFEWFSTYNKLYTVHHFRACRDSKVYNTFNVNDLFYICNGSVGEKLLEIIFPEIVGNLNEEEV